MHDYFDVSRRSSLREIVHSDVGSLTEWSAADAERPETAARFVAGVLLDHTRRSAHCLRPGWLNRRFRRSLLHEATRKFRLSRAARANVRAVFEQNPGRAVHDLYLHRPDLQAEYPLALLPVGQKRFVQWLCNFGRQEAGLTDEQIIWFLHETASDLPIGVRETYLIRPDWQRRFPGLLVNRRQERRFLRWLHGQFPDWHALREVKHIRHVRLQQKRAFAWPSVFIRKRLGSACSGVNMLAHFCYPSGLQRAALTARTVLEAAGIQTSCRDVPSGVQTILEDRVPWLGLEIYPVTLIMVAPIPYFERVYAQAGLARRTGVYRIATWYWELDAIPEDWARLAESVDEMWAPTQFIADTMRTRLTIPIDDMLPAVSLGPVERVPRARIGIGDDHYLFFFMFDMCSQFERKNPIAIIRAFRRAFSTTEKVALLIKVTRGDADPASLRILREAAKTAGVTIIEELVSHSEALGYIEMCDCFVSLHRSEGFGLPLAEAMLLGKPVIATNYSGNLSFMRPENSWLVDYELKEITERGPIYTQGNRWAEPSEEHAATLMREVFEKRTEAHTRANRAQSELTRKLSLQAAGQRMAKRLHKIAIIGTPSQN
jgi:glycosyltransferase involved in cell wall biosynthesis